MKKFGNFLTVLFLIAAVCFVRGYVTLFVPLGSFGVLVSKTSGVYEKAITNGAFCWRWERLIPTNTKLHIFSAVTHKSDKTVAGNLPSAGMIMLYAPPEKADFSYSLTVRTIVQLRENALPALVEKGIDSDIKLTEYISQKSSEAAQAAVSYVLQITKENLRSTIDADDVNRVKNYLENDENFSAITIKDFVFVNVKLPDMELYEKARLSYMEYRSALDDAVMRNVNVGADMAIKNAAELNRLEQLAAIIEKHPALAAVLKNSDLR
ncbi:MAG: hypothetical protein Ta2A_06320 [Treponemataceae bacterium]|nr:MAG: hypothetical protein Ta2A_06320 [Treponemataceae bacterium]